MLNVGPPYFFHENPSIMDSRLLWTNFLVPRVSIIEGFYCTVGQHCFADIIFLRIAKHYNSRSWYFRGFGPTNKLIIDYTVWANKSLKSYSWTWYFPYFIQIRENVILSLQTRFLHDLNKNSLIGTTSLLSSRSRCTGSYILKNRVYVGSTFYNKR